MAYGSRSTLLEPVDLAEHLDRIELYLGQVCRLAGHLEDAARLLDEQGADPDEGQEAADLRHRRDRDGDADQAGQGQGHEPRRGDRRRPALPRGARRGAESAALSARRHHSTPVGRAAGARRSAPGRRSSSTATRRSRSASAGSAAAARPGGSRSRRGVLEPLRGLELALGGDHLRAPLALGLGLAGHRPLHALRDLDVLHLDDRDLDAPRRGLLVDDPLQDRVDLLALRRAARRASAGRAPSAASSARSATSRPCSSRSGRSPPSGRRSGSTRPRSRAPARCPS